MRTPTLLTSLALVALSLTACTTSHPQDLGNAIQPSSAPATSAPAAAATLPPDTGAAALKSAVRAYSAAWFAGDGATAYRLLSKRCSTKISQAMYAATVTQGAKAYGHQAITSLTVNQISGDLARVSYTYGVPMLNQASQPWTREGGAWHYDAC